MSNDGRLDIACRYIPHDQWITTHIEPSWKIHVVKQWILSKCTGSEFDAPPSQAPLHVHVTPLLHTRKKGRGSKKTPIDTGDSAGGGERPVSPITFAPDPRQRPISPILFAKAGTVGKERRERRKPREIVADDMGPTSGTATPTKSVEAESVGDAEDGAEEKDDDKGGYEEDDEWDTAEEFDDDDDDDLDLPISPVSMSPGGPILPAPKKLPSTFTSPRNGKADQTQTGFFTLIRFSTGQILEDEYLVSWYNLAPHELLELHSHVSSPSEDLPKGTVGSKHTRNASIFSTTTSGHAELERPPEQRYLPRLNRTSLSTYILPYFEGWVCALRVVWREDALSQAFGAGHAQYMESAYGLPAGEDGRRHGRRRAQQVGEGEGDEMGGRQGAYRTDGRMTSLEWRQRWLVVTEGWIRLYRKREESNPTHELPLSALMTLRGKDHLEQGTHLTHKPIHGNHLSKPHRDHRRKQDMYGTHTGSVHLDTIPRPHRSLSLNRSHSPSRSRTGHRYANYGSDSQSDSRTPGGAGGVGREVRRHRGRGHGHGGTHGIDHIGGQEITRREGEERHIVCMKFRSRSKWVVPVSEPSPAEPRKRYASTQAGYGGGGLDGHGMGVTSFVTVGHGGAGKDGKLKSKGKGKEKEEKKAKTRGKFKKEKLDKSSLEKALAMSAGGVGRGPYLREANIYDAGASSKVVGGEERKDKGRARTFGGKSKEKEKDNDRVMSLGMGLGLGLGLVAWKSDKDKKQRKEPTTSRSTFAASESHASSSTAISTRTMGTSTSHTTASASLHTKPGAMSSGDEDDADGVPTEEEGEVDEDGHSSSDGEVRFARLFPQAELGSDEDYEIITKDARVFAKVVSDEDEAGCSVPSDTETAPHRPSHPHMDLPSDSEGSVALSDPVFAHSDDECSDDEDVCMEGLAAEDKRIRYGYRFGYRYETSGATRWGTQEKLETGAGEAGVAAAQAGESGGAAGDTQRRRTRPQREREQEEKDKGEWVILDLGGDLAFSSFLRILHRHFPPPISSSFISGYPTFQTPTPMSTPTPTPTPTPFPSPTSPRSPVSATPFVWPSSSDNLLGKIEARDTEPPSPLSTSSRGSRFRFEPPQHPAALASLAVHTSLPVHKTFGALPYPEWRIEIAERAQKAGMGDVGKAMRWVLWGCAEQLADDLAEVQLRNHGDEEANDAASKSRGKMKSFTLKNRRQSMASAAGAKPGSLYDSDVSEDTGKILMNMSDSEGEGSEAEWHGWMADLHRQHQVQSQKEREAAEDALKHHSEEEDEDAPPKNQQEDQRRYLEQRRALEPHGVVTTASPILQSVQTTPSNTLYSPSSSESLAHHQRARALSFSPVDPTSSATTSNPPSSLSHQHTPSSSPPDNFLDRKHPLPPGASLTHSTSLYNPGLRDAIPESSLRRPSMPTLIAQAEQAFSLVGSSALAPQTSILRSPTTSNFIFPAAASSVSRSPPFSPAFSSSFNAHETIISSTVSVGPATMPRRASSAGLMNIGSVGGSLGRSSSVLARSGGLLKKDAAKEAERVREKEREREKKAKDKEEKAREKEEKAREKDKIKDRAKEKAKARPKLSLATPSSATTTNPTQTEQALPQQVKSPKMDSIMRRVRSGSNLRQTEPEDDQPTSPTRDGYGASSGRRKGVLVHGVERIVRGLDSALDFVDGKS